MIINWKRQVFTNKRDKCHHVIPSFHLKVILFAQNLLYYTRYKDIQSKNIILNNYITMIFWTSKTAVELYIFAIEVILKKYQSTK